MISQPGLPGPPGPPGLPGSPGSMVSTASLFCCCLYPFKLMLMVHDVFQGLQGVSGPKVRVSALVLIHTEERTHLSLHGFVFYCRVNLDME